MSDKMYECAECGKKGKVSDLEVRKGGLVSCPECGYNFIIEGIETPAKPKLVPKKKQ